MSDVVWLHCPAVQVEVVEGPPQQVEADVLAFPVSEPVALPAGARALDGRVGARLADLIESGELRGKRGRITVVHTDRELAARRLAAAGVGEVGKVDADGLRTAAARVALRAAKVGAETVAWLLEETSFGLSAAEQARAIVDGTVLGAYDPGRWKTTAHAPARVDRLVFCGAGAATAGDEARRAGVVARWANRCRDLVNAPPNELTPARLAEEADGIAAGSRHLRAEWLGPEEIRAAGMGAFAAVARGSDAPPRLITLRYDPPGVADGVVLGLVGKAITFDSGGISLKPPERLDAMKADMGGGAAVICGLAAIAELDVPVRALAVVAACENMPSGRALRPGDVVTAANGRTIEITNTDAEGRLVLADALWAARDSGATHLLDLATLTAGMVTAMGDFYAGLFGNEADWVERIRKAAEASGDHAWPWPLHDTYRRYVRSSFADMKNSSEYKQATPAYAARFLQEFAGEGPWAHLDIAGTAYLERTRGDYLRQKGATGYGVRLLAELARRLV
jgi:leucyl aminopeptidase